VGSIVSFRKLYISSLFRNRRKKRPGAGGGGGAKRIMAVLRMESLVVINLLLVTRN
jgi:hypothetical protein